MGYQTAEALLAAPRFSLAAPYERGRIRDLMSNLDLRDKTAIPIYEFDGMHKDATIIRLEAVLHTIRWDGVPALWTAFLNVSDRQRAEIALEDGERRYRDLIDQNPPRHSDCRWQWQPAIDQ